jgi:hypothetical protein
MARPNIELATTLTGKTLYATIHWNGMIWNNSTLAFESFTSGNWTHYAIALVEQAGSGYYSAAYPAAIAAGVLSTEVAYLQVGGTPSLSTDTVVGQGQSQGVNLINVAGSMTAAPKMGASADSFVIGAAQSGTLSTTQMSTNLADTLAGAYVGRVVIWTSGVLTGVVSPIQNYDGAGLLSYLPVPAAPSAADTFVIV